MSPRVPGRLNHAPLLFFFFFTCHSISFSRDAKEKTKLVTGLLPSQLALRTAQAPRRQVTCIHIPPHASRHCPSCLRVPQGRRLGCAARTTPLVSRDAVCLHRPFLLARNAPFYSDSRLCRGARAAELHQFIRSFFPQNFWKIAREN